MELPKKRSTGGLKIVHRDATTILQKEITALKQEVIELKKKSAVDNNVANQHHHFIQVGVGSKNRAVAISDILYVEANGNYTKIHTQLRSFLVSKTLKAIQAMLPADQFIRCHQSYLINQKEIEGYYSKKGMFIQLKNEVAIPVSRRQKNSVLHALSSFNF